MTEQTARMVRDLLSGLAKMPPYAGITFRGIGDGATLGTEVATCVTEGLVATSRDVRVASENFSTRGLYAVVGRAGRAIETVSQHPAEREVVFLPGAVFGHVTTVRDGDLPIVLVEQLDLDRDPEDPKQDLQETLAIVATLVDAGRRGEPVQVTTPGKFVGDIR